MSLLISSEEQSCAFICQNIYRNSRVGFSYCVLEEWVLRSSLGLDRRHFHDLHTGFFLESWQPLLGSPSAYLLQTDSLSFSCSTHNKHHNVTDSFTARGGKHLGVNLLRQRWQQHLDSDQRVCHLSCFLTTTRKPKPQSERRRAAADPGGLAV